MQKYSQELLEALKETSRKQVALNDVVFEHGSHQDLFNAALSCYEAIGELIETLEEQDENMDPEKTNLPNLDEVFAGDPASDYVDALISYKQGTGKLADVIAAGERLADFQNGVEPVEEEEEEEIYEDSVAGFAKDIMDHNGITGDFAQGMAHQIELGFQRINGSTGLTLQCVGHDANQGRVEVVLSETDKEYVVKCNNKEYSYEKKAKKEYEGFCSEYPTEPVPDAEELFNATHPEEEQVKELSLGDYVTQFGFGIYKPMELLDMIQGILDSKNVFTNEDYKLIRFYLKQKPFNEPEDIDTMSKRALELAWRRFKYMRNVK